jgi:hypothetical protein
VEASIKRHVSVLTAVLLVTALLVTPAFAAGDQGDDAWHFDLAPFYGWFVTVDGTTGVGPVDQKTKADFGDIWNNLDTAVTGHVEARKGRWGGIIDVNYMSLNPKETLPSGVTLGVDIKSTMVEIDGFYGVRRDAHLFDIIAGVRYTKQETDISFNPPGVKAGVDADWWDPIVGGRWIWGFAPQWQLTARGDIGGFGVGSDFTWNAAALVIWQPWTHVSFGAGYRALDQDYEDGEGPDRYKFDATMYGPLAGINFRW